MSNHCPKCGTCHEEDDGRVCAACTTWDALAEKRARQDAEIESLRKSNQMFVQAIESWKKLHRAAVGALAKKMEENAALAERLAGAVQALAPFAEAFDERHPNGYEEATEGFTAFMDGNRITPSMTMGDFRRASIATAAALQALRTKLEKA